MNRRKILAFIGLSPLVPFAAKAVPAGQWTKPNGCERIQWTYVRGGSGYAELGPGVWLTRRERV